MVSSLPTTSTATLSGLGKSHRRRAAQDVSTEDIQGIEEIIQAEHEFDRVCEEEEWEITRPAREEKEQAEAKAREEKERAKAKTRRKQKLRLIDGVVQPFRYWDRLAAPLQMLIYTFVGAMGVVYPAVFQLVVPIPRKVYPPTSDHYSGWCSSPKGRSITLQEHRFYYIADRRFFSQIQKAIKRTEDRAEKKRLEELFCHLATTIEDGWWWDEGEWVCPNGMCKYHLAVGRRVNHDSTGDDNYAESMSWDEEDWDDYRSRPSYRIGTQIVCLERFRPVSAPSAKFIRRSLLWNECVCGAEYGLGDSACHCMHLRNLPVLDVHQMKKMSNEWQAAETAEARAEEERERIRKEEDARYFARLRLYEERRTARLEKTLGRHRPPPVKISNYYAALNTAEGE